MARKTQCNHPHPAALQAEIRRLQATTPTGLAALTRQYEPLKQLVELIAELAWLAEPAKAANTEVVARSRGHNLSDGIALLGTDIATPGYAVKYRRDAGRLGAAISKIAKTVKDIKKDLDPEYRRTPDDRPRCGSRACPKPNHRQPHGIKYCGFCGRNLESVTATR